jgi:hypothetical protein
MFVYPNMWNLRVTMSWKSNKDFPLGAKLRTLQSTICNTEVLTWKGNNNLYLLVLLTYKSLST